MPLPLPQSNRAANWLSQLRELSSSLNTDPTNPSAYLWRVHVKILCYLLARYGSDPNLDYGRGEPAPARPLPKLVFYEANAFPLHSHAMIHSKLMHIAEINRLKSK